MHAHAVRFIIKESFKGNKTKTGEEKKPCGGATKTEERQEYKISDSKRKKKKTTTTTTTTKQRTWRDKEKGFAKSLLFLWQCAPNTRCLFENNRR